MTTQRRREFFYIVWAIKRKVTITSQQCEKNITMFCDETI